MGLIGWGIAAAAIVLVLALVLFAPFDARLTLRPKAGLAFRLQWLGIPLVATGVRKLQRDPKPHKAKGGKRRQRRRARPSPMQLGRAAFAVARTPGAYSLLRRSVRQAIDAVDLQHASLSLTIGLGDSFWTSMVAGLVRTSRPRFEIGEGRTHFEFTADFGERRFDAYGIVRARTRLAPFVWLALTLLCSRTVWRARRAWREELDA
jgi:hypothetical protein